MIMPSMYMFIFLYIISFMLVMGGDDWFEIWIGLEINMISFIMIMYQRFNEVNLESCLKYFFVQSLGSAMFMGGLYLNGVYVSGVLMLILSYKMGGAPLYFWFPSVCSGLSWLSCFVLMSFQKIIPLMLLSVYTGGMIMFIIVMSLILGTFGSFGQKEYKSLMAYSSIHHLGWILLCGLYSDVIWVLYLFVYGIVVFVIMSELGDMEVLSFILKSSWKKKWWFFLNMLSVAGIPPLLGFFLKWMAFVVVLDLGFVWVFMLIFLSIVMFYVYFRMIYDLVLCYKMHMNYIDGMEMEKYNYKMDNLGVMGLIMGMGLVVLLWV